MVSSEHVHMQAVELRSRLQREIAAKEKEAKERELRELAMRARMDRVGGGAPAPAASRAAGTAAAGPPSDWRPCHRIPLPGSGPYLSHLASDFASQRNIAPLCMLASAWNLGNTRLAIARPLARLAGSVCCEGLGWLTEGSLLPRGCSPGGGGGAAAAAAPRQGAREQGGARGAHAP